MSTVSDRVAVFVCSHHAGHLNPILSLVPLFQRNNYQVHFFTAASRKSKIEATGATFHVDGPKYQGDIDAATKEIIRNKFQCQPTVNAEGGLFFEQILPITVAYFEDGLVERIRALKPSVIISDVSALWGVLAAKMLQVPLITSCSCSLMDSMVPFEYLRGLDFLQKCSSWLQAQYRIRYDPRDSYLNESDFLINWSVRGFQVAEKRHAPNVFYFGAAMPQDFTGYLQEQERQDRESGDSMMKWCDQAKQEGKKIIYCSLGTVVGQEKWTLTGSEGDMVADFYRNVFSFLGDKSEYACIVSIGQNRSIEDMGTIPSNFFVRQRIPQVLLLAAHADAFITHCGNNGVHESLYTGTPMLCVPVFGDQHPNADTICRLKLGVQIASPFAPAPSPNLDHITAENLCTKLIEVLGDGSIRDACEKYKGMMQKQHEYFHSQAVGDMENYIQNWGVHNASEENDHSQETGAVVQNIKGLMAC